MKIAIDITPISDSQKGHKIRGVGFYLEYLKRALVTYYPDNTYFFFSQGQEIDKHVDIVHYPYFEPFFLTPFSKTLTRVITVHDLTPLAFPKHFPVGIRGKFVWHIQKRNLLQSNRIITDSYASQKDIVKIAGVPKEKVGVAYLAAADEFKKLEKGKWEEKIRGKYKLPEKFVLYVGDVTWNKNLPRLIEAIKKINLPLVMIGKTLIDTDFDATHPWNKDLVKVHKLIEGDNRFIRLGFVPTEDLVELYNIATLLVFPSVYEGFGLPILEAMQSGCPVVLSKESCMPEVGGDAGYYIDGYDTSNIANGIVEVFRNSKLQKELSEKGFLQSKKFSWKKTAEDTIKIYHEALTTH